MRVIQPATGSRRSGLRRASLTFALAAALMGTAVGVGACGGSDEPQASEDGPTKLRVAVIPIAPVAPLYLGIEEGFFDDEQLTVEPAVVDAGSPTVPAVLRGDFQFAFANTVSLLAATEQGLDIRIVTQGVVGEEDSSAAWSEVLVRDDSPISSPADLEGKTIAVNAMSNIGDLTIMHAAEKKGVDPASLKFIEIPFPDMLGALEEGRVDAIWAVEPFVTLGREAGARSIVAPYSTTTPDLTIATYFTSAKYAESNPDVVERFASAMNRSLEYAQSNPDAVREVVPEFTEIPQGVAKQMELPVWGADLNLPTIELTGELAARYGILEQVPQPDEIILEQ